ncbi:alpha/beta hydrolase family protein [Paenibacillus taihuensis]|uniref:Alpha/beta hydrolase family protein n=1 Tax=Paenibacillus taihuensis TaxID=1156355 RepID=A0A3D9RY75_9BACL|nr:alpha/beta fold hydrolase [Paenibacillus taihuensis]REE84388.1 alpha/beta hydrolase family protein [Paenibacillus taihuensis]
MEREFRASHASNDGILIHYLDSVDVADRTLTPLLICPGLSETAEEYMDLMRYLLPRRCVVLSFRGRGGSDTPASGYNLDSHIADMKAVIRASGLEQFHLFAHSRGVSYALGYVQEQLSSNGSVQAVSLLLSDYPAEHRRMPEGWADDYITNYLIPFERTGNIRPAAVWGIQHEAEQIDLSAPIELIEHALILRGALEGSLLSEPDVETYKSMFAKCHVEALTHSGHNLMGNERLNCSELIRAFLGEKT